jgi:hypothetical protein
MRCLLVSSFAMICCYMYWHVQAQEPTFSNYGYPSMIYGRVYYYEENLPISGATVTISGACLETPITVTTDIQGWYCIPFFNSYKIVADALGYGSQVRTEIDLRPFTSLNISFWLAGGTVDFFFPKSQMIDYRQIGGRLVVNNNENKGGVTIVNQ